MVEYVQASEETGARFLRPYTRTHTHRPSLHETPHPQRTSFMTRHKCPNSFGYTHVRHKCHKHLLPSPSHKRPKQIEHRIVRHKCPNQLHYASNPSRMSQTLFTPFVQNNGSRRSHSRGGGRVGWSGDPCGRLSVPNPNTPCGGAGTLAVA